MAKKCLRCSNPIPFGNNTSNRDTTSFYRTDPTQATWRPPRGWRATWPPAPCGRQRPMCRRPWMIATTRATTTLWFSCDISLILCENKTAASIFEAVEAVIRGRAQNLDENDSRGYWKSSATSVLLTIVVCVGKLMKKKACFLQQRHRWSSSSKRGTVYTEKESWCTEKQLEVDKTKSSQIATL